MGRVILLCGKQGSGKSTIASELAWSITNSFRRRFAGPLYEIGEMVYEYASSRGVELDKEAPAFKRLLQVVGTDWGRESVDKDIWVKLAVNNIRSQDAKYPGLCHIFDDCRFENELHAFPDAIKVLLVADRDARKKRADRWREQEDHPSETGLDNVPASAYDLVLYTSPDHPEYSTVAQAVEKITKLL